MTEDGNDVGGVIDFGDLTYSNTVFDLSIAMAYPMVHPP